MRRYAFRSRRSAGDCVRPHVCGVGWVNATRAKSAIISHKGQGAQTGGRSHRLEPRTLVLFPVYQFRHVFPMNLQEPQSPKARVNAFPKCILPDILLLSRRLGRILSRGTITNIRPPLNRHWRLPVTHGPSQFKLPRELPSCPISHYIAHTSSHDDSDKFRSRRFNNL